MEMRCETDQIPALRASEERYRSLFNSIDEGFCVFEMLFDDDCNPVDFRFLETNPAFEKQSGLIDAVGKCVRTLVPQLEAHWFETYGRVALTGESIRFVDEAQALDGRWFDVYAFRLGAPELRQVAILFTDISVRKRLEEKTLEQANSLAELNRRKDEFLAMLSHELRNPLAAIRNAAQLIQMERNPDPIQLEAQEMLDRQVAQLTRLVDDLLDVSRISTGRVRLKIESVDLRDVVRRAVEIVRPQVDRKGQTLTLSLPEKALRVLGDDVRLEQVIVNLLNNANKYTDRSGLLAVELRTEGDEAVLCVRDNGIGIEPEVLPRIFDLFTQADQSLTRAQGGLGVGLALVQSLVTMHGGRIEAHSAPGQGSEFIVRLPCALRSARAPCRSGRNRAGAASCTQSAGRGGQSGCGPEHRETPRGRGARCPRGSGWRERDAPGARVCARRDAARYRLADRGRFAGGEVDSTGAGTEERVADRTDGVRSGLGQAGHAGRRIRLSPRETGGLQDDRKHPGDRGRACSNRPACTDPREGS